MRRLSAAGATLAMVALALATQLWPGQPDKCRLGQYVVCGRDRPPGSPPEDAGATEDGGVTLDEDTVEEGAELEPWAPVEGGSWSHRWGGCHYVVLQACGRAPDIELPVPETADVREVWRSEIYDRPQGAPRLKRIRPLSSGSPWWACACRIRDGGPCQVYRSPAPGELEQWFPAPYGETLPAGQWRGAGCLRKPCTIAAETIADLHVDPSMPEVCR